MIKSRVQFINYYHMINFLQFFLQTKVEVVLLSIRFTLFMFSQTNKQNYNLKLYITQLLWKKKKRKIFALMLFLFQEINVFQMKKLIINTKTSSYHRQNDGKVVLHNFIEAHYMRKWYHKSKVYSLILTVTYNVIEQII